MVVMINNKSNVTCIQSLQYSKSAYILSCYLIFTITLLSLKSYCYSHTAGGGCGWDTAACRRHLVSSWQKWDSNWGFSQLAAQSLSHCAPPCLHTTGMFRCVKASTGNCFQHTSARLCSQSLYGVVVVVSQWYNPGLRLRATTGELRQEKWSLFPDLILWEALRKAFAYIQVTLPLVTGKNFSQPLDISLATEYSLYLHYPCNVWHCSLA